MGVIGPAGFFWFLALVNLAIAVYSAWRLTRRRPTDTPSLFTTIAPRGTSVLVAALNPEVWDDDEPKFPTAEIPMVEVSED